MNRIQVNIYQQGARQKLAEKMPIDDCVYMCIGTNAVLSDSLGPYVGTLLQERMQRPVFVYGLKEHNITAVNLLGIYRLVKTLHPDKKIVVIDAGVGDSDEVGTVIYADTPLLPGAATNKNLPALGDYSIIGIVARRGLQDFYTSSVQKQTLLADMADVICGAITLSQTECNKKCDITRERHMRKVYRRSDKALPVPQTQVITYG